MMSQGFVRGWGGVRGLAALALLLVVQPLSAHFVWVEAESTGGKTRLLAGFGEPGDWDESLSDRIAQTKYFVRDAAGKQQPVTLKFDEKEGCFLGTTEQTAPFALIASCDYGIFQRGNSAPSMLRYFAKTLVGSPETWSKTKGSKELAIEVTPSLGKDGIVLEISTANGPLAEGKVTAYGPKSSRLSLEVKDGKAIWPNEGPGKYSLFVGHKIDEKGTADGTEYETAAHYATLVFTIPGKQAADVSKVIELPTLPLLPEAVSSFGAAVVDGWLYVYSGHTGGAHQHSLANLSKSFRRVKLEPGAKWEQLPAGTPLQGMPMVAHSGKVYRIGGLTATNDTTEEDAQLHSVKEFQCFDPATGKWTALADLPEGRSSHDAVVIGDKLYVVGGWTLSPDDEVWHTHSLVYDLKSEKGQWEKLPEQPFERRALAAGTFDGKLYAIGGMNSDGEISLETDIFDPKTGKWSKGPNLPGVPKELRTGMGRMENINGFGATAWNHEGKLYVGTYSGQIFQLEGEQWKEVATLAMPRFFHRLLPLDKGRMIAVGGASMSGHLSVIEVVDIENANKPSLSRWDVQTPIDTDHSEAMLLQSGKLIIAGGNKSPEPHNFAAEYLSTQAVTLNLAEMKAEPLPALPSGRQTSGIITQRVDRSTSQTVVIGGLANGGEGVIGLTQAVVLTSGGDQWRTVENVLPDARAMFDLVQHDKKVWVFGGAIPKSDEPVTEVLAWDTADKGDVQFAKTGIQLPQPRRSFAGAVLNDRFYLVCGVNSDGVLKTADVFNFKTKEWESIPAPAQPRIFAQLIAFNNKLYLLGGVSPSEERHFAANDTIEVFDPATGKWSTLDVKLPQVGTSMKAFAADHRIVFCGTNASEGTVQVAFLKP